ncbi:hypothetical protein MKX03_018989, partial [Papaver bracteatum]
SVSLSSCKMAGASPASQSPAAESTQLTTSITPQFVAAQDTQQATPDLAPESEPKKKGKVRSKVWNDFERLNDKEAQCKHCKKKLQADSRGNGTSKDEDTFRHMSIIQTKS